MSFKKPPLSQEEKEKKAENFIGYLDKPATTPKKQNTERVLKRERAKPFVLRAPETMLLDLKEIAALTSISINSICLELLRPEVKKKLKELKEIS
jgi:hypothetical protein